MRRCKRCGQPHPEPPKLPGIYSTSVCPKCMTLSVGEMLGDDDRADPSDWGGLGWT